MAMTTRCPHCGTAFKVVADQLRVRNGLVRCGVCSRVFDGYAAAVDNPAHAAPRPDAGPDVAEAPGITSPVLSVRAGPDSPFAARTPPASPSTAATPAAPSTPATPAPASAATPTTAASTVQPAAPVSTPARPSPPAPSALPVQPSMPVTTPASAPWRSENSTGVQPPTGFQSPYEPHEPHTRYESRQRRGALEHGERWEPRKQHESRDQREQAEPRAPYVPPITPAPAMPLSRQPAAPAHRDAGLASTGSSATPEPAVLRGRDDNRRIPPAGDDPLFSSDTPSAVRDSDDEEDVFGYREPYAPYRQDDLDDAEQQARDMASRRDSRFPIYAHRGVIDDEEGPVYVPIPGEARTRYDDMTDAGMAPPIFMDEEVQRRRTLSGRLWAAGCVLGLIVLGMQWIYIYRTAIATAVPALRPVFENVCAQFGCQVGYARRLERISITASSLQPQSGAAVDGGPMRLVLAVTMRNRYDKSQPWPALMLQLTDLSDTVVVRKVLLPENYLPPGTPRFFAAGGEQSISVPLQVDGPHVNGYQLDKFFP